MKPSRLSIPFSATILLLMALVLAPLSSALLWLGWRSVDALEQRSADARVAEVLMVCRKTGPAWRSSRRRSSSS